MKGRDKMGSTLPNLSLNSLNVSTRVGISQSSFNKFNKTMLQLNNQTANNTEIEEKKSVRSLSQISQQSQVNENNDHYLFRNGKEKQKKNALITVNMQPSALSEYKYVPPRRPRYIRCINNQMLNNKQNLSKSLPSYGKIHNSFGEESNFNSQSNNDEYESSTNSHLAQFGDPSDCYCKIVSYPRTPALPLRIKIKMAAKDAETNSVQQQRANSTFGCSNEGENSIANEDQNNISKTEKINAETGLKNDYYDKNNNFQFSKPKNENVQCMALKYFGESGDLIGCFSTKIPVHFPVNEKDKIKNRLRNSYPNPQPNPLNSSPRSIQSKNHFSRFISLS